MVSIVPAAPNESGPSAVGRWFGLVVIVVGFLLSIQLLSAATAALAPSIEATIGVVVASGSDALGASWLASYVLLNGSLVAAIAISFFAANLVTPSELFLLLAGSRLGSAGVVVLVGAFDHLQERRTSIREATGLGSLSFLVIHSIYLPATALGYLVVGRRELTTDLGLVGSQVRLPTLLTPIPSEVVDAVGAPAAFVVAIAGLVGVLRLFDRLLSGVRTDGIRARSARMLGDRWRSFVLGMLLTAVTTSVAFSLGIVVPLYNRSYVTRDQIIPYILGAGVGTLADTIVVAVVLGTPVGVAVVILLLGATSVATLLALIGYASYRTSVVAVHDRMLADPWAYAAFLVALVVVPLLLVVG